MDDLVKRWKMAARRDDLFDHMVPSDVRQLIVHIERLRIDLAEVDGLVATHQYQIDSTRRELWPDDSILIRALKRHSGRAALSPSDTIPEGQKDG